jgi:hypothetical protein
VTHNVPSLGEVADFGKININFKQNIMRNVNVNEPQSQQSCQTSVSNSSLDKLISKLPVVYDWVKEKYDWLRYS